VPEHAAAVIAPPYDVVSTAEARALVAGQPNSFLHVSRPEIGLPDGTDPYSDAVYARARENLERLKALGLLIRDPVPAYYAYRMQMGKHEQTGIALTASIAAYDANRIRKHERTRPAKENDRVRNMKYLNAQTGPVLSAYRADAALKALLEEIKAGEPLFEVTGQYDVVHTVWSAHEPARVAAISEAFDAMEAIYIADGHHRSAAASRLAAERRAGEPLGAAASCEYFLTVVFPHDEMEILDYNRLVIDLSGLKPADLLDRIRERFDVGTSDGPVKPAGPGAFGMYLDGRWHRLLIRRELIPDHDPVARLDVQLLQDHLLAPLLGVGDPRTDPRIDFVGGVRGLVELERRVDSGEAAAAFALYPTSMEQLMAVADAEQLMPPKSTWFEPKLADGLLSHVLD
jgi:uncharacterized protein (DUF1015 family)